jgi:ribosomal protein L34E
MCACGIQLDFKKDEATCQGCGKAYETVAKKRIREVRKEEGL